MPYADRVREQVEGWQGWHVEKVEGGPMDRTRIKIALCVAAVMSMSASFSVLAHAQSAGLNGLDPNRHGRIAAVPVAHEGTKIAPAVLRQSSEAPVTAAATVALAAAAAGRHRRQAALPGDRDAVRAARAMPDRRRARKEGCARGDRG
jgi:hypothetical protein